MVAAIALALAFAVTNGFHDSANAIATLVATRAARPGPAIALASVCNVVGSLVLGTAVADAVAGILDVSGEEAIVAVGSALFAAVVWNLLTWWRGLPSSSGHALVGGLVGAGLATAGASAIHWGGVSDGRPVGALGVIIALALAPLAGLALGVAFDRGVRTALKRATRRLRGPVRDGQWTMSAALALGHGANDAQKSMGVVAVLLLAGGQTTTLSVPVWVRLACATALTIGTAIGGWRVVRTIGRRLFHLRPLDGLASEAASGAVLLTASFAGAAVSTTHVVTASVVGVGGGRRRWRHVRWLVVRSVGSAWLLTLPATAALGALTVPLWKAIA